MAAARASSETAQPVSAPGERAGPSWQGRRQGTFSAAWPFRVRSAVDRRAGEQTKREQGLAGASDERRMPIRARKLGGKNIIWHNTKFSFNLLPSLPHLRPHHPHPPPPPAPAPTSAPCTLPPLGPSQLFPSPSLECAAPRTCITASQHRRMVAEGSSRGSQGTDAAHEACMQTEDRRVACRQDDRGQSAPPIGGRAEQC